MLGVARESLFFVNGFSNVHNDYVSVIWAAYAEFVTSRPLVIELMVIPVIVIG